MSRSKKKHGKYGFCSGSNTEYYREANRALRAKKREVLDSYRIGAIDEDEIVFPEKFKDVGFTSWDEPTDGSVHVTPKELEKIKNKDYRLYRKIKFK